uniref:Zinc finger GRF-type domain-containing protein n=1 Tax=Aegilops tauschii subsp. strangulata TaxID=200361 RepID=A0A453HYA0_AEGTS
HLRHARLQSMPALTQPRSPLYCCTGRPLSSSSSSPPPPPPPPPPFHCFPTFPPLTIWISIASISDLSLYLAVPTMVSSSSSMPAVSLTAPEDIAPLPLIRCPRCNLGVIQWFISETSLNPGCHFYKCEFRDVRICAQMF